MVPAVQFIDRDREIAALEEFWTSPRAQCIGVRGRRRVGKTYLLEHFARGKRVVYHRCALKGTGEQLHDLGAALAERSADPVLMAQPPSSWPAVFAVVERLATSERLLLLLDEIPYWVARDESVPSMLQNWWDERGRHLDLMLVLCGSAVQMMEHLFTGDAPLAGCLTGQLLVRPFDFRAAARMLDRANPVEQLTAYGILGGVPLYLSYFRPERSLAENIRKSVASAEARLYVEPPSVFAAHHASYDANQAMDVLRAIACGNHQWADIRDAVRFSDQQLVRVLARLTDDLGLVEKVTPIVGRKVKAGREQPARETGRVRRTQYHLADNFFRFWFRFIEPQQGSIEFGDADAVVDAIMRQLADYMGLPFESICRQWVRAASAAGVLPVRLAEVGTWWAPDHEIDVVGLDSERFVAATGECKWQNQWFGSDELEVYLRHVGALAQEQRLRPDALHVLFSKSGFTDSVRAWASANRTRLLTPTDLVHHLGSEPAGARSTRDLGGRRAGHR